MKRFCVLVLSAALMLPLASCAAGTAAETAVVAEAVVTSAAPNESVKEETLPAAVDDGGISAEPDEAETVKLAAANVTATAGGTVEDTEPAYWNGMDFGPNAGYEEEYVQQGDPGEYLTAAEGAQKAFYFAKENGNVPEYSDETEYTIVLTDITDVNGEECYVYRLDIDEPTGTLGAAYAYGCQSGNIYMEGYGGQWVIISGTNFDDIFDFSSMILSFWHGSGAGAWSTDITVNEDGTFEGTYHDSDMGSSGEGYPNGTVYTNFFTGRFSPLTKISDTEYSLTVDSLELGEEPDTEEIFEEVKHVYTEASGIANGDEFRLYLPDMPVEELSEDYLGWAWAALEEGSETLGIVGLYNLTQAAGFMGDSAEDIAFASDGAPALYADFTFGGGAGPNVKEYPFEADGELTPEALLAGLTELTGYDFFADVTRTEMGIIVDWKKDSTLIANLDDREQKEEFFMHDVDSMRWFMMDSLYQTLLKNFHEENIFYTMDGGKELTFTDSELYPYNTFPTDIPYMGAAFYFEHTDGRGLIENENDASSYLLEALAEAGYATVDTAVILEEDAGDAWFGDMAVWFYSWGANTSEKFTAEKRFAVTYDWEIWEYDPVAEEWNLII